MTCEKVKLNTTPLHSLLPLYFNSISIPENPSFVFLFANKISAQKVSCFLSKTKYTNIVLIIYIQQLFHAEFAFTFAYFVVFVAAAVVVIIIISIFYFESRKLLFFFLL